MPRVFPVLTTALALLAGNPGSTLIRPAHISPRSIRMQVLQQRKDSVQNGRYTYPAALQQIYRNNQYGFSVRYPQAWTMQESRQLKGSSLSTIVLFLSPLETEKDASRENINIVIENLPSATMTLDAYTEAALENEKAVFDGQYTVLASHDIPLGDMTAHRLAFIGRIGDGGPVWFEQIWFIRNGAAHVWTLAALEGSSDRYAQIFRGMLDTIAFRL